MRKLQLGLTPKPPPCHMLKEEGKSGDDETTEKEGDTPPLEENIHGQRFT